MIRRSAPLLVLLACGGAGPDPSIPSRDGGVDAWTIDAASSVEKTRRMAASDECIGAAPGNPLGCEYYFFHQVQETVLEEPSKCLAVLLANVSSYAAKVAVEFRGKSANVPDVVRLVSGAGPNPQYALLPPSGIPPGEVAVVSLSQGWNDGANGLCPSKAVAMHDNTVPLKPEGFGQAFRIRTSVPVAAYAINDFASRDVGNDNGVALRSVHSWATRYVLPGTMTPIPRPFTNIEERSFTAVVASQDGTTVLIGGIKYGLSLRGDVYTFTDDDQRIGEVIQADKPIAVFAGSGLAQIPVDAEPGDPTVHQVAPPSQWGFEYVGVRYRDRWEGSALFQPGDDEAPLWRLLAEQDTTLTYELARPAHRRRLNRANCTRSSRRGRSSCEAMRNTRSILRRR